VVVTAPPADPAAIEKARAAMRDRLNQVAPTAPAAAPAVAASSAQAPTADRKPKPRLASSFQPLPAPALPISNDKQQRLKDLLSKYRADEITPEQYHQERAKILAEQ
jgi:hypothetical protein